MEPQDITGAGLPDAAQLTSSDPSTAVTDVALTLEELQKVTGKKFPSKEAALKSIEDTNAYVGKKKEAIEQEVLARLGSDQKLSGIESELANLRKDMFFKDHPEFAEHRKLLEKIDPDPSKASASDEFKTIFEKAKGYDETQKLKTVLESNPRIASSRDALSKAREASKVGDTETLNANIAKAIRESHNF